MPKENQPTSDQGPVWMCAVCKRYFPKSQLVQVQAKAKGFGALMKQLQSGGESPGYEVKLVCKDDFDAYQAKHAPKSGGPFG